MLCSRLMSKPVLEILNHHVGPGITFSSPSTVRFLIGNRHKDPKWKKFRALKVIPVDLPDFHKPQKPFAEMTPEEVRSHYKEKGIQPIRPWYERHITFSSSGNIVEPYVPPEGDEKKSPLNSAGAKQKLEWLKKKGKSWRELRTIRKYDDEFDLYPDFVEKAHDVYMKAHTALAENNHEDLLSYVTEKAYPEMVFGTRNKTIRWQFIKTLEPHRVSHVRTLELLSRENVFAQITVRFHTQQTLAIYDRFGRLIHGSETIAKDVLEYVVYEKQLSSEYGDWRLHGKIIPDWLPEKEPAPRTYIEVVDKEDESKTQAEAESDVSAPIVTVPSAGNEIAVPK